MADYLNTYAARDQARTYLGATGEFAWNHPGIAVGTVWYGGKAAIAGGSKIKTVWNTWRGVTTPPDASKVPLGTRLWNGASNVTKWAPAAMIAVDVLKTGYDSYQHSAASQEDQAQLTDAKVIGLKAEKPNAGVLLEVFPKEKKVNTETTHYMGARKYTLKDNGQVHIRFGDDTQYDPKEKNNPNDGITSEDEAHDKAIRSLGTRSETSMDIKAVVNKMAKYIDGKIEILQTESKTKSPEKIDHTELNAMLSFLTDYMKSTEANPDLAAKRLIDKIHTSITANQAILPDLDKETLDKFNAAIGSTGDTAIESEQHIPTKRDVTIKDNHKVPKQEIDEAIKSIEAKLNNIEEKYQEHSDHNDKPLYDEKSSDRTHYNEAVKHLVDEKHIDAIYTQLSDSEKEVLRKTINKPILNGEIHDLPTALQDLKKVESSLEASANHPQTESTTRPHNNSSDIDLKKLSNAIKDIRKESLTDTDKTDLCDWFKVKIKENDPKSIEFIKGLLTAETNSTAVDDTTKKAYLTFVKDHNINSTFAEPLEDTKLTDLMLWFRKDLGTKMK